MQSTPGISVVIPVLNEARSINALIAHVRSLAPVDAVEIVVVDGDRAGSTLRAIGHPLVVTAIAEAGRASQMNHGAALATGGVLLFLHADTFLPRNAFALIREAMEDRRCCAGCFDLGIDSDRKVFRITEHYVALRTRITRIPFGDQAVFMRKDDFERIGGYRCIPIMEDVELMGRIRKRGGKLRIVPGKVRTSARRWEQDGIVLGTLRNWALQLLYVAGVPPERLARFYRS